MTHFLEDDNGKPLGLVDMDAIQAAGTRLGYALSVASNDPTRLDAVTSQALVDIGSTSFGYVTASALRFVVEDVLQPLIEVAEAYGHPIRERLQDAARQADAALPPRSDLAGDG